MVSAADRKLLQDLNLPPEKIKFTVSGDGRSWKCNKCGEVLVFEKEQAQYWISRGHSPARVRKALVKAMKRLLNDHQEKHLKERINTLRRDGQRAVQEEIKNTKQKLSSGDVD